MQLLEIPNISITDNNPWEASGTALFDRFNGVRIRPGMTIKLMGLSDYSGYYLVDTVSFSDISPDPVSISFKKPDKEPKDIKDLPIGARGPQTIDIENQVGIDSRTMTYDITRAGSMFFKKRAVKGIFPLPDADHRTEYYPEHTEGIIISGNIDLYERPVLVSGNYPKTASPVWIYPWTEAGVNGGKPFTLLLTSIWTIDGAPVQLTNQQTVDKYIVDGKFIAKARGKSKSNSIANAAIYSSSVQAQQGELLIKRFPTGKYVNTPGSE